MSTYQKSIVAAGHDQVCGAAAAILRRGGNAFDAVVAAGFASAVAEPALTSLGGGGFMLGYDAKRGQEMFFDFFVDTPGKGRSGTDLNPHFFPVTVNFSGTSQIFNVGFGSVAVPGILKGLLHIHKKLGRMPLADVVRPARELATGHILNAQQAHFLELLQPIMTHTATGRALYTPKGSVLKSGETLVNCEISAYLERIVAEGDESFYRGEVAREIAGDMARGDGLLTYEDLSGYQVIERRPLSVPYRDAVVLTAPEPSMGGTLIALSLWLRGSMEGRTTDWGSADYLQNTLHLMQKVEELRKQGITTPSALKKYINNGAREPGAAARARQFSRGTTHVSIADSSGNCASMTCSNGEGSGYFAPGTGIMLNNMMGEDDLHPDGFHSSPPGQRVLSMMSPSMLMQDDAIRLVIGSGGSKRIRTAISQVLSQVVDHDRTLTAAIEAPRLYWDEDCVQLEPGFSDKAVAGLKDFAKVHVWQQRDVYFGGVHAVIPGKEGGGDPRRGGAVMEIFEKTQKTE